MPQYLHNYFDYKVYAHDLFIEDFVDYDDHVFRR